MKIRLATYDDLQAILRIRYAIIEEEAERNPAYIEGVTDRDMQILEFRTREWLLDRNVGVCLAEDGDTPAGYAVLRPAERVLLPCVPCVAVPGLWMAPEHRKGPGGHLLLRWLLRAAQALESPCLQFTVMDGNRDLLHALGQKGYNPVSRTFEIPVRRAV